MANNPDVKKYLDKEGLKHFAKILANYPDNTILAAVIDAISDTITETSTSDRKYTDDTILSNYGNLGEIFIGELEDIELPEGCKVLIDAEDDEIEWLMNEIRTYIDDTLYPKHTLVIDVNTYDGSPITQDVYVSIFNTDTDELYAKIKYENKLISLRMPANFNYNIMVDELPGYFINSKSGTLTKDTELSFNYQIHTAFGVTWDKTSTTVLSRYGAAALFEDPVPYISGATEYGSPFDRCEPWCNINVVEDPTAGTLVAIPKYWFKWTDADGMLRLEIANYAAEGFSVSPAHRDRGDGKGERDVVYIGRYHCSINNYKSETGVKPKASMTRANFRTNIHNLGDTIYQNDFAMFWTIRMLYLVEYGDWNSQKVIGYGCGNNSSTEVMGYTDSMPYHTGTMLSSRTTYGVGTQYRYIEGVWDNVVDWCDGIYFSGANIYGIFNPNNFSDTTGGTLVGTRPTSSGYIKSWGISDVEGFDWLLYPATVGGSTTTYVPDSCNYNSSGVVLYVGGYYYQSLYRGMFCLVGSDSASYSNGSIGSRLMVLP